MMTTVWIAFGSNLGERLAFIEQALEALSEKLTDFRASSIYETAPIDCEAGAPAFLNGVCGGQTSMGASSLLAWLHELETQAGRQRRYKHAARTLDLDLLFYGQQCLQEPGLTLPHPRLAERAFVLKPLVELAPELQHPGLNKSIRELWLAFSAAHPKPQVSPFAPCPSPWRALPERS